MKEVWMEDVNSMALKLCDIIKQEWDVDDVNKEEQIFIDLASTLENYSNGEYRSHN